MQKAVGPENDAEFPKPAKLQLLFIPLSGADPGLNVGVAKYTARVSAREILCATPTFDVISAHDMLYEEKVNK